MAFRSPPEALLRPLLRAVGCGDRAPFAAARRLQTAAAAAFSASAPPRATGPMEAVCQVLGAPLVLQPQVRQTLSSSQVRVKVHHAAVNFADILMAKGQ